MKYYQNPKARYQRDICLAELGNLGEAFLLNYTHLNEILPVGVLSFMGVLFELNLTSALIWEYLNEPASAQDLYEYLQSLFEVEETELKQDVSDIVNKLVYVNLILCDE